MAFYLSYDSPVYLNNSQLLLILYFDLNTGQNLSDYIGFKFVNDKFILPVRGLGFKT